jgi:hypothetical protein
MIKSDGKSAGFETPNIFYLLEVALQEAVDVDGPLTLMEVLRSHNYLSTSSRRRWSRSYSFSFRSPFDITFYFYF